ncbi:hypothetical protein M5K25_026609 [Dendrobium thyrsiflorum]|uniref:Uncharacterized protein n=1 Tax=Dendrobium thyrsiflorum TaxID=117978 RepID=A0ABD0TXY1_DENTH
MATFATSKLSSWLPIQQNGTSSKEVEMKGCGKKAGRMALRGRQIRWPALRLDRRVGRVRFKKWKSSEHGGFQMVEFGAIDRGRVVVKLSMIDAKKRSKAMQCAAGLIGILSLSVDGDNMTVVGNSIDVMKLTMLLRKKLGLLNLLN